MESDLVDRVKVLWEIAKKEGKIAQEKFSRETTQLKDLPVTTKFKRHNDSSIYMKVKPVSYILNSNTVAESLANGKVLIVNLDSGSVFFIKGDEFVRTFGY